MLTIDTNIANAISIGRSFDIITFDFKRAFDRASHRAVLIYLSNQEAVCNSLRWLASFFLSERTQTVKVGNSCSQTGSVPSGAVQCSILGIVFFTVLLDMLLRQIHLQAVAFADSVKFISAISVSQMVVTKVTVKPSLQKLAHLLAQYGGLYK